MSTDFVPVSTTSEFWKTAKGSHVHSSWYCANTRRLIASGDPIPATADEMPPCEHCTPTGMQTEYAKKAAQVAEEFCKNNGVTHPQRVYSHCRTCGKQGKVNRSTGSLRKHKPAK